MVDKSNYFKTPRDNENTTVYGYDPDILTETIRLRLLNNAAIVRDLGDSSVGKQGSVLGQFKTTNNMNSESNGGRYSFTGSATGNPEPGTSGTLDYYRTDNERTQIVVTYTGNLYWRVKSSDSNFTSADKWNKVGVTIITNIASYDSTQNRFEDSGGNAVNVTNDSIVLLPQAAYDGAVADSDFTPNSTAIFLTR